jgi:hypothetical protein
VYQFSRRKMAMDMGKKQAACELGEMPDPGRYVKNTLQGDKNYFSICRYVLSLFEAWVVS